MLNVRVDMGKLHCGMQTQQWNNGIVKNVTQNLAPLVTLRGFLRCDFPSLASRRCSSKTVYFVITAKNLINNTIPYVGMNINKHIYIVSGILLSINNEITVHEFIINNNKVFYEHDSLFSLFNSLSRDLKARLDIH